MVFGMSSSSTLLLNSKVLLPNPAAKFESPKLKLRTTQLETIPDHLSCTVVFEIFNTSDVSFSAANSSSLVASYSSRCFSNWACVSWCSSSRLRFSAAAYQNENCPPHPEPFALPLPPLAWPSNPPPISCGPPPASLSFPPFLWLSLQFRPSHAPMKSREVTVLHKHCAWMHRRIVCVFCNWVPLVLGGLCPEFLKH